MKYRRVAQNLRVPGSFVLALGYLFLSKPDLTLLIIGSAVALLGILLRLWAAGYIVKGKGLTTAGPYAFIRHPLYLGSIIIGTGFSIIGGSALVAILFALYFFFLYLPVIRQEEAELRSVFREEYDAYARHVPLLVPHFKFKNLDHDRFKATTERQFDFRLVFLNKEYNSILGFIAAVFLIYLKIHHFQIP